VPPAVFGEFKFKMSERICGSRQNIRGHSGGYNQIRTF
jgi:hypothetical protein